jgi:hypothetical protein
MAAVVVEAFVEHFDRNFSEIRDEMYQEFPREYPTFLKVEQTDKAFIKSTYMGGLGMPVRNRDMEPIPFQTPTKGPIALFTPVGYRSGYQIERQMIEQEEWGLLANRPRTMLYGAAILMDIAAANLFNNGFTAQSYDTGYDQSGTAKPLFSATNTLENLSGTWSNVIPQNLPITVETVFYVITTLLYNMVDSRGLPISYTGSFNIYVPTTSPTLWQQAIEVVNSVMNPGTTDNKINSLTKQFRLNVVPLRHLTNPDHWFITWDPSSPNYGLKMVVNVYPDITPLTPFGGNPDAWFSRLRMRFTVGYDNKRGVAAVGA